jgi:hypothetical protein
MKKGIPRMKVKIAIESASPIDGSMLGMRHTVVWEGELEILQDTEYVTKISLIGEGEPQPLCDVPWAIGVGHYVWVPPAPIFDGAYGAGWNVEGARNAGKS